MIAGVATGLLPSYEETIARFVSEGEVFEPDPARHAFYREKYEKYAKIYPRVSDLLETASGN
jgi:xylulokinase